MCCRKMLFHKEMAVLLPPIVECQKRKEKDRKPVHQRLEAVQQEAEGLWEDYY